MTENTPGKPNSADNFGVMVCGHGSRNRNAVGQFSVLAERLRLSQALPDVMPLDEGIQTGLPEESIR